MIPLAPRIKSIHLLPVGDDISLGFLDDLAASLARVFTVSCHVRDVRLDAESARDPLRNQYHSTAILRDLVPLVAEKDGLRLVGVTEYDLFVPVLTFVFGEAQLDGACALVSLHRLREEFYGLDPNPDLLLDRALKEAVHELGHTFGLRHCPDWRCVMASTHSVERLDLKQAQFCASCARVVAQGW
ncbi:MAG: archaemetzincin family Zn-dependent metalloprotease [Bryobacteraceae bacterium]